MNNKIAKAKFSEKLFVEFSLSGNFFGADIQTIKEITPIPQITKTPNSPDFIEGIGNIRNNIAAIVDLSKRFNYTNVNYNEHSRLILTNFHNVNVGFMVEQIIMPINKIKTSEIKPPPPFIAGINSKYIFGIYPKNDKMLILLDINEILSDAEKVIIEGALNK